MPRLPHEALVQLVRNAPTLVTNLIWPERQIEASAVHISQAEVVDLHLAEYRADGLILIGEDPRRPSAALVTEVQTTIDAKKRVSWLIYVVGPHLRYGCPVDLVVIALDPEVATWAGRPIRLGTLAGGLTLTPQVIGPERIPAVTDIEVARRSPELAVLSVAAHADEPGAEHVALAALAATHDLDNDRGTLYPDFVLALLGEVARKALEKLMQSGRYEYQSDFARKYFAAGKVEGEAKLLIRLLELKGFELSDADRERILGTRECAQLEAWAERVLVAKTLDEVFGE
ncbi:MAG: hypothetical protein H6711_30205 [Myxococcales bacterium]|nr:hypothetical protein [Myxococcales bacterium]